MTRAAAFRHEALLYRGEDEFVRRTEPFLREGLEAGEAILVAVGARKIERLRDRLGGDAAEIRFVDMAEAGHNPARIIPLWRRFVEANAGRAMRGIGEPIDASRDAHALVECQRHESLLNVAFADSPPWRLVCPYDTEGLEAAAIEEVLRSHPYVHDGVVTESALYRGLDASGRPLEALLPESPADALTLEFDGGGTRELRTLVAQRVAELGATGHQADGFVLAVHELVANSIRHGGGSGTVRLWAEPDAIVAEVSDRGRILDPLAGRVQPPPEAERGRGLWLANHLADLVQIRVRPDGGVVRVRLRRERDP